MRQRLIGLLLILAAFTGFTSGPAAADLLDDPAFLTEVRCIGCHGDPARMALRGKTRLGWYINTHRMAAINDAHVSWRERHIIATHLHRQRPASGGFQAVEYAALPVSVALWIFLRWRARRRS